MKLPNNLVNIVEDVYVIKFNIVDDQLIREVMQEF